MCVYIWSRARRVAMQARQRPETAKAARAWLALAACRALRLNDGDLARRLSELEASIV